MAARERNSSGFSLIEVTFAVLILAGGLVTLLGLQSSSLQLASRDRFTQRAMLLARQILAPIETSKEPIDIQDVEGTAAELLDRFQPGAPISEEMLKIPFQARLKVEFWGIPNVNEEAMKRLTLTLAWSESPLDRFEIVYFMPNEGDQTEIPDEEVG